MSIKIVPVILAGGTGSRIWPLSKKNNPKQFLKIFHSKSLFQLTLEKIIYLQKKNNKIINNPIVVTNEEYRFFCKNQLREYSLDSQIILEPEPKNTAISIALAAKLCHEKYENSILIVMPSDHIIKNKNIMFNTISKILKNIIKHPNSLGLIGIKPSFPSTEYGYMETSKIENNLFEVLNFFEKPNLANAKKYISNNYLWNSGLFVFNNNTYLDFILSDNFFNNNLNLCWEKKSLDLNFYRPNHKFFNMLNKISFDNYFVEKLIDLNIPVYASILDCEWNDLGSWESIEKHVNSSKNNLFNIKSNNNFILSDQKTIMVGVNGVIVCQDKDFLFIADKRSIAKHSKLINELSKKKSKELEPNNQVHRPWGFYEILDKHSNFLTKKITLYAKSRLSYQKHNFRSEHWVVIFGSIKVIINDELFTLKSNQSIDIPKNSKHRMINDSNKIAIVIEIQSGSVLSEDDVIRFDDDYSRA